MDIRIHRYCFREMTNVADHLVYTAHGNVYSISFNMENRPHITRTLRTTHATDIPKEILQEFYWEIRENYPTGFHTRNNQYADWILSCFSEIVRSSIFNIDEPLDPCGGVMINGKYLDAYVITLSLLDNPSGIEPQNCVITGDEEQRKIYFFRYFAERADFGNYKPNQVLKISPRTDLERTGIDKQHHLIFFDDIVAATIYSYDDNNQLLRSEVAIRNDIAGSDIVSTLGRFIVTSSISYSE